MCNIRITVRRIYIYIYTIFINIFNHTVCKYYSIACRIPRGEEEKLDISRSASPLATTNTPHHSERMYGRLSSYPNYIHNDGLRYFRV